MGVRRLYGGEEGGGKGGAEGREEVKTVGDGADGEIADKLAQQNIGRVARGMGYAQGDGGGD